MFRRQARQRRNEPGDVGPDAVVGDEPGNDPDADDGPEAPPGCNL